MNGGASGGSFTEGLSRPAVRSRRRFPGLFGLRAVHEGETLASRAFTKANSWRKRSRGLHGTRPRFTCGRDRGLAQHGLAERDPVRHAHRRQRRRHLPCCIRNVRPGQRAPEEYEAGIILSEFHMPTECRR